MRVTSGMTYDEWWEQNYANEYPDGFANYTFGEEVWNAAQEAMLRPLLGAGDEEGANASTAT